MPQEVKNSCSGLAPRAPATDSRARSVRTLASLISLQACELQPGALEDCEGYFEESRDFQIDPEKSAAFDKGFSYKDHIRERGDARKRSGSAPLPHGSRRGSRDEVRSAA